MTEYLKTELNPDGVAAIKGELHKVTERNDATEFSFADAQFFQRRASERWHDLVWEMEPVREGKYLVKTQK